jgi:predicted transcriptional regulator
MKKEDLYKQYAIDANLKTYHYKVLFLLMGKNRTQSEICSVLGISKQNLNKICRDLLSIGFISYGEVIGRNKYLKINSNPETQVIGQLTLKNI